MSTNPKARAWVQVSADALRANYVRVADAAGGAALLPMVKANAYGVGVQDVVSRLEPHDPWGFGVATVAEGAALRGMGVTRPIVVCSPAPPGEEEDAVRHDLQLFISNASALHRLAEAARAAGRAVDFHIDLDTGMGRSGFDRRDAAAWLPAMRSRDGLARCVGFATHLHSADEDEASVMQQLERLDEVLGVAETAWGDGALEGVAIHVFNSAGVFRPTGRATAIVRPGIFLYGGEIGEGQPVPDPVVSIHARVARICNANPATTLGYGATYASSDAERWATLAIGYGDGLPRALGNRGSAIIGGARVPIIGRISMDVTVVDISGVSAVREGDVATLLGEDGGERISLDEIASEAGTISYEVLTGLTARLPRVWTDGEG